MNWKPYRLSLLALCVLMTTWLSACGFQFRGNDEYESDLKEIAIIGRYANNDLGKQLARKAENYGMTVSSSAPWAIEITDDKLTSMRLTGTQTADTDEFLLKRDVTFNLIHRHYEELSEPSSSNITEVNSEVYGPVKSTTQATYQDNQNQVLGKDNERTIILNEMLDKLARQMLRQAERISLNPPDCTENPNHTTTTDAAATTDATTKDATTKDAAKTDDEDTSEPTE